MASRQEIDARLSVLGTLYGEKITDPLVTIWHSAIGHLDDRDIAAALNRHVADPDKGQFFPKPADVMRNVSGTWGERGLLAWTTFDQALKRHGPYTPLVFDDARIHAVVQDMGGMARFANCDLREWPFVAKEFQTRYAGYRSMPKVERQPLLGIGNAFHGSQEPVEIPSLTSQSRQLAGPEEQGGRREIEGAKA